MEDLGLTGLLPYQHHGTSLSLYHYFLFMSWLWINLFYINPGLGYIQVVWNFLWNSRRNSLGPRDLWDRILRLNELTQVKFGLNSVDLSRRSQGVNTPTAPTRCRYLDQQFQTTCCFLYGIRSIVHLVLTPWDLLDRSTELRPNFTWVSSFNLKILGQCYF